MQLAAVAVVLDQRLRLAVVDAQALLDRLRRVVVAILVTAADPLLWTALIAVVLVRERDA